MQLPLDRFDVASSEYRPHHSPTRRSLFKPGTWHILSESQSAPLGSLSDIICLEDAAVVRDAAVARIPAVVRIPEVLEIQGDAASLPAPET